MTDSVHSGCLRMASCILNRYQDIEDVFDDESLTNLQKLERIRQLNGEIGELVSTYLPE